MHSSVYGYEMSISNSREFNCMRDSFKLDLTSISLKVRERWICLYEME